MNRTTNRSSTLNILKLERQFELYIIKKLQFTYLLISKTNKAEYPAQQKAKRSLKVGNLKMESYTLPDLLYNRKATLGIFYTTERQT